MPKQSNKTSEDTNGGASARVADVLKSKVEHQLIDDHPVTVAGHASHVVSAMFAPDGTVTQDEGQSAESWDDEKYREFVERLSKLREPAE